MSQLKGRNVEKMSPMKVRKDALLAWDLGWLKTGEMWRYGTSVCQLYFTRGFQNDR